MPRSLLFVSPLLIALVACDSAPNPPAADQPLPKPLCDQVKAGLAKLSAGGGIEIDGQGEAVMPEAAWAAIGVGQRDQLVKLLAYSASCAAGAQSEAQSVVIRSDEGQELVRRTVSTKIDMSAALNGLGQDVAR